MAVEYLKRAAKTPETETVTARNVAADMIAEIAAAANKRCATTLGSSTNGPGTSW